MSLQKQVMDKMKEAMKAKDTVALTALRALKSAFMLANTEAGAGELTEAEELKIIQKQVKQRKDSATVFTEQGRDDLAEPELAEAAILEQFLPEALSEEEIGNIVEKTGGNVQGIGSYRGFRESLKREPVVGIKTAELIEAKMVNRDAYVTVKFVSEQVNVTRDADGHVIDGDPNHVGSITDIWTFARNTRSKDPNWKLIETRSQN